MIRTLYLGKCGTRALTAATCSTAVSGSHDPWPEREPSSFALAKFRACYPVSNQVFDTFQKGSEILTFPVRTVADASCRASSRSKKANWSWL
ncbi:hypothetical protein TWF730_011154 [Orbilia blumenaviensis]|uniref:Secreted protein n=1 Tax=Orbilia blumenaviensis TaxID=1796055 RepID=A0AAV9UKC2_9PEZI